MAQKSIDDDDDGFSEINVTPLVDVMLVLLVIFMVTANYITQQSIAMQLPKASSGDATGTINLGLTLDKGSRLYLDGKPIDYAELKSKIDSEKTKGKVLQALISADNGTPHGSVIKLMDEMRKQGVTDIAFNVEIEVTKAAKPTKAIK